MYLIDTHTHLFSEQFDSDRDEIVIETITAGINKLILPGIDSTYTKSQFDMVEKYPENCFVAPGLHPTHVKDGFEKELELVEQNLSGNNVVAIGETGLDLFWDKTNLANQIISFEHQIQLAKKYKLPIIIHVREAFDETFEVVERLNNENLIGIFHSFVGTFEQAQKIISFGGFKMGINGIVTFKNSGLDKVLEQIPIENFVLETDSPWLAPAPYRGKRNQSSYLVNIANKMAEIYKIPVEILAEQMNKNSFEIFSRLV